MTRTGNGRRTRALVTIAAGVALAPFLTGVVTAYADDVPVAEQPPVVEPVPVEAPLVTAPSEVLPEQTVETVPDPAATDPALTPEPEAPADGDRPPEIAPDWRLVTITPSVDDDDPVVGVAEDGPTVTVEPAVDGGDAEVIVEAAADGPELLEVLLEAEEPSTAPVAPLSVLVTAPSADLDRPRVTLTTDESGAVSGLIVTPAAAGPAVLDLDLWAGADMLSSPIVDVGAAGSSIVHITLPAPAAATMPAVAFAAPALGEGLPTVKLRALGASGNALRVTLVPRPLGLPAAPAAGAAEPLPGPAHPATSPEPDVADGTSTPAVPVAPPAPPRVAPASSPASSPEAPALGPDLVAMPTTVPRPVPPHGAMYDIQHAAPRVVTEVGRRSVDTARRFPLPTGLAVALGIFLVVQGRVDRRDPRLAASPQDDELLSFR